MKRLVNRVQLIGNLGSDPVLMTVGKGNALAKFSLATHEVFINREGERSKETTWHNVIAWGPLAEKLAGLLQKGAEVALSGKIRNRVYEDTQGQRRYVSEVVADDFYRITRNPGTPAASGETAAASLPF
jgi:single-strand DNA-binding protein